MIKVYTKEFIKFIRDIAPGKRSSEIAVMAASKYPELNITVSKIQGLMSRYKIRNGLKCGSEPRWKEEHFEFLREFIPGHSEKEIQKALEEKFGEKTTINNIGNLKSKLGIKSGTFGGRFQKGQISFNKGKKWADFMSEEGQKKSRKTCFKKGNIPLNRVEIGYERVNSDGYVQVKVQDNHKNDNFKLKHYLVWESHYGPVPKGYMLRFLDGNKQNCDINNLALVSESEKLYLSKMKRITDPELHKGQILIAKVLNKANKCKKQKVESDEDLQTCVMFDITKNDLRKQVKNND